MSIDNPKENMTSDQISVLEDYDSMKVEEYKFSYRNHLKARKSCQISLPATSRSGKPVVHRSRLICDRVSDYWKARCNLLGLSWDYQLELQKEMGVSEDVF